MLWTSVMVLPFTRQLLRFVATLAWQSSLTGPASRSSPPSAACPRRLLTPTSGAPCSSGSLLHPLRPAAARAGRVRGYVLRPTTSFHLTMG